MENTVGCRGDMLWGQLERRPSIAAHPEPEEASGQRFVVKLSSGGDKGGGAGGEGVGGCNKRPKKHREEQGQKGRLQKQRITCNKGQGGREFVCAGGE